jgi:FkbM family methyltransferase
MNKAQEKSASSWDVIRLIYRAWHYRLGRDKQEVLTLLDYLKPGQLAVDIGAHKGAYTYWMQRAVGPTGKVVAFEPQPRLASRLRALVAKMSLIQVTIEQMGLSDSPATGELFVPGDGGSSPGASLVGKSITGAHTTISDIKLETLDRYFPEGRPVSLIKCDVEGHELAVFKSGKKLLERDHPLIMFECEERHQSGHTMGDVFHFLEGLGYRGHFFHQGSSYPLTEFRAQMQADPKSRDYVNNFIFIYKIP